MKTILPPKKGEYAPYFETYLSILPDIELEVLILEQIEELKTFLALKPVGWDTKPYQAGKWTPREVIGHIIDTDRMMTFRALCIARGEKAHLPGFDQDTYVANANFAQVSMEALLMDFTFQRKSIVSMMGLLPADSLDYQGVANGNMVTPKALLWIIPAHFIHHLTILKERY